MIADVEGVSSPMGQPPNGLTPYASALHFFGAELRHHRERAGLSQRQLALCVFLSADLVGKVEMARRFPSLDLAKRCDEVLDAGGILTRLHPLVAAERTGKSADSASAAINPAELLAALGLLVAAADVTPLTQAPDATSLMQRIDRVLKAAESGAHLRPAARGLV